MSRRTLSSSTAGASLDAPPVGRRITHATNSSTTSLSTFQSFKPQSLSIPRIRILLAPYMSPFVVPMHKVETWDLLNKALKSLFGLDLFNSSIRITDHHGNSILPSVWKDLLEPDMTIIVDTCSLQAENSPILFETPVVRSISPPTSPSYTVRESEDSWYDAASTFITPRGCLIGQAVPMPPNPMTTAGMFNVHNRKPSRGMLKNWAQKVEEEDKRSTSVSMFTGVSSKQKNPQAPKPSGKEKEKEKENQSAPEKRQEEGEEQGHKHDLDRQDNKVKQRHFKSTFSRFARAVLCVLSGGTLQSSTKETIRSPEKKKRTPEKPRRTITMEAIENNPSKSQSSTHVHRVPSERRKISLSRRRGIPSLPPVSTPPTTIYKPPIIPSDLAFMNAEPRRSKSLSHLKIHSISSKATSSLSALSPAGSIKHRPRSKSFTSIRNSSRPSVISPPIPPRRPSLELGVNAQYKSLSMDKAEIQEIFNDLDGATLSGTRSRSGTGDTTSTVVSATPTLVLDKPLPKLPFKFSAFPAPSPPRSPLIMAGFHRNVLRPMTPSEDEDFARPATAVTRKITRVTLRKVASSDFSGIRKKRSIGAF